MSKHIDRNLNLWTVITLAIVFGLVAGVLGMVFSRIYIWPDLSETFFSQLNLSNLNNDSHAFIIRNPKTVVVNQDAKVAETVRNVRPVLVGVFQKIASSTLKMGNKRNYYNLSNPLFSALVITSDGWLLSLPDSKLKNNFKIKDYVAISNDRQLYYFDKIIKLKDLPGQPLLLHLAKASNLIVKKIVSRAELNLGESLLLMNKQDEVWPTNLASVRKVPTVLSSELINARLILTEPASGFKNYFVFDLAGNLVAFITDQGVVVPAFSYNLAWHNLLSKEKISQVYFGVNYLDLSLIQDNRLKLERGALLHSSSSSPAVVKGSPAQLAGLRAGDVITWLNNQQLDNKHDLADLLSQYQPGDVVTVTYLRAGIEKSLDIKLAVLESLKDKK